MSMKRIASPQELQAELKSILAFVQHSEKPSRGIIVSKLRELANRLASTDAVNTIKRMLRGPQSSSPGGDGWWVGADDDGITITFREKDNLHDMTITLFDAPEVLAGSMRSGEAFITIGYEEDRRVARKELDFSSEDGVKRVIREAQSLWKSKT